MKTIIRFISEKEWNSVEKRDTECSLEWMENHYVSYWIKPSKRKGYIYINYLNTYMEIQEVVWSHVDDKAIYQIILLAEE